MSSPRSRSRPSAGTRGLGEFERALGVGLAVSVLLHATLLLLPPLHVEVPGHLTTTDRLALMPPPAEPPPEVDVPAAPEPVARPAEPRVSAGGQPVAAETAEPTFVPHDVRPRLVNPEEVQQYLRIFYPMALRIASVEGAVHLWLYVNESGRATKLQIRESSGSEEFDELARSAAPLMKFRPALNRGETVGVWVSLWVRFDLREAPLQDADARLAGGASEGGG